MKASSLFYGMFLAVVVIAVLLLIFGVNFGNSAKNATYRADAEIQVAGVVTDTDEFACPVSAGEVGSHLKLNTENGIVVVHLAPARVMRSQSFHFQRGDKLEVRGSTVRLFGESGVIAREIARGNDVFTIRDRQGKLMLVQ